MKKKVDPKHADRTDLTNVLSTERIQEIFVALLNSCTEGYTGEWDPTGEGRDGFEAMASNLMELAIHYNVDVSDAKEI
jgi:hypothetical protein